ncbi:MAG TPA: peptidylprolyl isomerase [Gaiellaceae bacterium]|jgi:peptidyl-prolyl cis-trans isomerase A (cyclophilin A)|nr:peptidylprolyl isomerase [Gaiellaceae bacterium]
MKRALLAAVAAAALAAGAAAASSPSLLRPASLHAKAPAVFRVRFTTTKGPFVVTVHRTWATRGADRFYNLVRAGFYNGQRLFRVVPGFVVQWGISGTPKIAKAWANATIRDDRVRHPNARGTIDFADAGPNTRTTQVFVNLAANTWLDSRGFAPFGVVTSGFATLRRLYHGYGDRPTSDQAQMTQHGEAFFRKHFPKLDRILKARVVR